MFLKFLNKISRRKLAFLQYLENAVVLTETKENLMENLEMTKFLITKTVQELNIDLYQIGLNGEFKILSEGENIKLIETNTSEIVASDALLAYYLNQSLKFSLLKDCFFEQLFSLYEFSSDHYLSHTPVYKEFKQLKLILKEYGIQVNKEFRLVAEEGELREFIFFNFIKDYYENQFLFADEVVKKQESFSRFFDQLWLNNEQSILKGNRLSLYLCIIITRIQNGHFIQKNIRSNSITPQQLTIIESIKLWLLEIAPKAPAECIEQEANALLCFLIVDGWLVDKQQYIDKEQSYIKQMNMNFLTAIQKQFTLSSEMLTSLCVEVTILHYELLSFSFGSREEHQNMDIKYFSDIYPEYAVFCNNYLNEGSNRFVSWNNRDFLFFRYLVLLIALIPLKEVSEPFYICVDFSYGSSYNQMIQKKIANILDLNIEFQNFPNDKTNLILSNLPVYEKHFTDHISWLTPPGVAEWIKFTEKIACIRRKKMNI
ncbi:helix-turn-helix domain-containing protein [Enterococcus gallinarum]|uniref:helix-turn-helix domain-containing protein n=2 Tax=Bacteria TaxID=2 RepID=UPI001D1797EE|nr:helix-turn-helix domain-containing protein [Enterococcus gallinarum]MCC4045121.1 helix-turn-helix domain-containing protein [Enterococcus gallinarum]